MTKTTCKISFAIALVTFAVLLAGPVQAADGRMRVTVPFRFIAGDTVMPAGTYFVDLMEYTRSLQLMSYEMGIRLPVNGPSVRRPTNPNGNGALLFEKIGATYVLRSVWNPNREEGCAVYRSKRVERELAAVPRGEFIFAWAR